MNILDNEVDVERVKGVADSLVNTGYDARIEFHRKTLVALDITTKDQLVVFFDELRRNLEVQIQEIVVAFFKNEGQNDEHRNVLPQPSSTREE
jgi:hypothetical protein